MTVIFTDSSFLPDASSYDYWCAVGKVKYRPEIPHQIPEIELKLEAAFDKIRKVWSGLAHGIVQIEPSAELSHFATCNTNVCDFGVMLAWSYLFEKWLGQKERILVICDDPWMSRHLASLGAESMLDQGSLWWPELILRLRGYLARSFFAVKIAYASIRLRNHRLVSLRGAPVLLVYGHPASDSEGYDAYFGNLMKQLPEVQRVIHVDCGPGRALDLAQDGRSSSLHCWGNLLFVARLPFIISRWPDKIGGGKYRWLVQRANALEYSTAQAAAIRWQKHCQKRWIASVPPKVIIWPWENHAWERDLVRTAREAGISVFGYQHTVVGRRHWVHLPQTNFDGAKSLPEKIFCTGKIWRQALLNYGHESDKLCVAGAHRFNVVSRVSRDRFAPIFLALPFKHELAMEMLRAVQRIASPEIQFLVKDHPMNPFSFEEKPGLSRTSIGMAEQPSLSAVIYAASTVGLEAMIAGIPIVRFIARGSPSVDVIPDSFTVMAATDERLSSCLKVAIGCDPPVVALDEIFAPPDMVLWRKALGVQL